MSRSCRSDYSTSEWDPITAAQEDNVRAQDRQRAAVCCVAVYQEADIAKGMFAKYNDLNFGKVIVAPDLTKQRPRILVATAYDFCNNASVHTTYVAFKGSDALETLFDVADSQLQCQGQDGSSVSMKGHIHNGFYKALKEELPGPMELMGFCASMVPDSQVDRLIFCGHGLGGALSHVSMLSLLFSLYGNNTEEARKTENTLLSIAFGAPLFLDEEARDYFSATGVVPVENRFLTYVNDEDPVPLMLNKLVAHPAQPTLHRKLNLKFQTILGVAGKVPTLLDTTDKVLLGGAAGSSSRRIPCKLPPNLKQLEETDADMTKLKSIQWARGRGYAAFGQFTRLSGRYQNPVAPSDFDNWTLRWTPDSVKYHAMGHYAWNVLTSQQSQVPVAIFAEGSLPKVDEAFLTIISRQPLGDGARLELVGYNLGLCLRKKCAVSDFEDKWEITRVEQNRIVLRNKIKLTAAEINVLANQMTKVKVETMFGVTDWIQVRRKVSGSGSHVIDGLKHVIGKLVIFYSVEETGPGSPSSQTLLKLKKHLDKVATLSDTRSFLKNFFLGLEHPNKPVFDKRKDADGFIEKVSNHLQQSTLKVKLEPIIGSGEKRQLFVRRGLGGFGFGMFSVGVGITMYVALAVIVSASTMGIAIPFAAGGLVIGAAALVLSHRSTIKLEEYDQIVKFIYGTLNPGQALIPGDKNVADYERAIIEKVKLITSRHPTAMTQIQHDLRHQIKETRETVINFITLMLEIDEAVGVAKEQKVLAVVGPENVGKSTLINILRKGPPREDLDEDEEEDQEPDQATTGFTIHTDDPKGYLAAAVGNLVAVDFPGMGAAHDRKSLSTMWEAFERLPDLCLVLMKFNGDVTADCADVPKEVRKKLCDKVVLMVNHVDGIMKGKKTAKIWKQYPPAKMEELRQAFLRNSDNMLDSVMLTSLSADLHDGEKDMLKDRGILFAADTLDQIRRLVYKCDKSSS